MTYSEMKNSGIPYIGEIPSHWRITKTLHCLSMPITDGPHTTPELYDSGVPFISAEAVSCGNGKIDFSHMRGYISEDFYEECCKKYVPQIDDIYMIKSGATTGRVAIVDTDRIFTIWSPLAAFRANRKRVLPKFLFYALQSDSYQKQVELGWTYGTQQNIGMRTLETLKICLPPLNEQTTIAAYLDRQFSVIDSIIDEAKTSIEEYRRWKASVVYQAVTKGLDPDVPMKDSGVSWIGEIPATWDTCAIKRFSTKIGSGKTPSGGAEVYSDTGVIFLRSQNVYNEGLRLSDVSHISPEIDDSMSNTRVRYNDVLLNITGGSMGRCCLFDLTDTQANVNQHVCIIRTVAEMVRPEFLRYFWISESGPMAIGQYQTGGNRPGLNFEQIGNTKIPLCSPDEQDGIIRYLDRRCKAIDNLIEEKQSLIAELEAYKKSLIYEAVTGKRKVG